MAKQCQSERTVQRHTALERSLLKLMRSKAFPEISVKDICLEAAIPRRTFYRYFAGKEDLMDALVNDLLLECDLEVMPEFTGGSDALRESLLRFYRFWGIKRREVLELLLQSNQAASIVRHEIRWALREYYRVEEGGNSAQAQMSAVASVSGVCSLLFHWVVSGCRESAGEMADHTARFLTVPVCGQKPHK